MESGGKRRFGDGERQIAKKDESDDETVVGTDVNVRHVAPALPGRALRIAGSGRQIGSKAYFDVVVDGDSQRIATARVVLAIVDEERFTSRLARTGQ